MKTVTGKIVSSTPVSLSRAAKIISKFAETEDNGASQAVKAYLRRSAAAFNELKKLHREMETSSKRKHRKAKSEPTIEAADEPSREPVQLSEDGERKKHKKRRNKEKMEVVKSEDLKISLIVEDKEEPRVETKLKKEDRNVDEIGAAESNGRPLKHKKKRKDAEVDEKVDVSSQKTISVVTVDQSEGKKHKNEKQSGAEVHEEEDGGEAAETKEGKKRRKRRKIKELEEKKEDVPEPIPELKQTEEKKKHEKKDKNGDQGQAEKDGVKTETEEWKDKESADIDGDKGNDSHKKKKKRRKA